MQMMVTMTIKVSNDGSEDVEGGNVVDDDDAPLWLCVGLAPACRSGDDTDV